MSRQLFILAALIPISCLVTAYKVHQEWKVAAFISGAIEHDGNIWRFCDGRPTPFGGR